MGALREDYLHYFTPHMELMSLFPISACFCVVLGKLLTLSGLYFLFYKVDYICSIELC